MLSKDCPHVAVVKAGRRPPAGHGLDDGAARTAAAPQWTRTPPGGPDCPSQGHTEDMSSPSLPNVTRISSRPTRDIRRSDRLAASPTFLSESSRGCDFGHRCRENGRRYGAPDTCRSSAGKLETPTPQLDITFFSPPLPATGAVGPKPDAERVTSVVPPKLLCLLLVPRKVRGLRRRPAGGVFAAALVTASQRAASGAGGVQGTLPSARSRSRGPGP